MPSFGRLLFSEWRKCLLLGGMLENQIEKESFNLESTEPAGFWIRVAAYLIDFLVLLVLVVASMFVKTAALYFVVLIPMLLYKPLLEGLLGGTAGKLALGLRVINPEGEKIGIVGGLVRSAIFLLPQIPGTMLKMKMLEQGISPFDTEAMATFQQSTMMLNVANLGLTAVAIISCIVVAFTLRKRGLHDMIADTYVIKLDKGND